MPAALPDFVRVRIERAGIDVAAANPTALATYLGLLTKWNETVNLTALELNPTSDQATDRLLIEPLLAATRVQSLITGPRHSAALRLLDVGSGGGSPAIPLAIALGTGRPVELRMVESRVRKAAFLRDAIRQIPLPGADVFNTRLEDLATRPELAQRFDVVSFRGVRAVPALWRDLAALLAKGGHILSFRPSGEPNTEVRGFVLESVVPLVKGSELLVLSRT